MKKEAIPFLLFLGAGASRSFGIPTAKEFALYYRYINELVNKWIRQLDDVVYCKVKNNSPLGSDVEYRSFQKKDIEGVMRYLKKLIKKGNDEESKIASMLLNQVKIIILERW